MSIAICRKSILDTCVSGSKSSAFASFFTCITPAATIFDAAYAEYSEKKQQLAKVAAGGSVTAKGLQAGRNALEMILAIYKSQKTGLPVKLPLTDFASTDMAGEF